MLRKLSFLAALLGAMVAGSAVQADVFYSGTFNANGSVAGGVNVANASSLNLAGGGISYNNVFGSGVGGASVVGDRIVAVGFVPLAGANQNTNTNTAFGTGNNLVAVYAFMGRVTSPPVAAGATFQMEVPGNDGVILIMNRSAAGALTLTDPSSWVNDINNLANGQVARLELNNLPTTPPFYSAGPPGPLTTEIPPVVNPAAVNTASTLFSASIQSSPEFKLEIVNGGTFLTNAQVFSPDGSVLTDYAMYLLLNQQVPVSQAVVPADIADLNTIAQALLGGQIFATGTGVLGSEYNNNIASGSGDIALNNTGGRAIFGGQFATAQVPEPASLIVWSVIAAGAGVGMIRRRRQTA